LGEKESDRSLVNDHSFALFDLIRCRVRPQAKIGGPIHARSRWSIRTFLRGQAEYNSSSCCLHPFRCREISRLNTLSGAQMASLDEGYNSNNCILKLLVFQKRIRNLDLVGRSIACPDIKHRQTTCFANQTTAEYNIR
jgi:hypothetical protein